MGAHGGLTVGPWPAYNRLDMRQAGRAVIMTLLLATAMAAAEPLCRTTRIGIETPDCWLEPTAPVAIDPWRGAIHPERVNEEAAFTYHFRAIGANPRLLFAFRAVMAGGADQVTCLAARDGRTFQPVARQTRREQAHEVDLGTWLAAGGAVWVRLCLRAANRASDVAVTALAWRGQDVALMSPADVRLPRSTWLYPAWAAHQARRYAMGLPPERWAATGPGRVTLPLASRWQADGGGDARLATAWFSGERRPVRVRQLLSPAGRNGARVTLDGVDCAVHALPYLPLGARLPDWLVGEVVPPLRLVGVPAAAEPQLLETGLLEIRHLLAARDELDAERWRLDLTVVNHSPQPRDGAIRALWTADETSATLAAYRFAPGASLATVFLDAGGGAPRLTVELADGDTLSDRLTTRVARPEGHLTHAGWASGEQVRPVLDGRWHDPAGCLSLAGRQDAVAVLAAPVEPALMALAEDVGARVLIEAPDALTALCQEWQYGGRPPLLAVAMRPWQAAAE